MAERSAFSVILEPCRVIIMKKILTLFLLAGAVLAYSSTPAAAIDVAIDGEYLLQYEIGSSGFHGDNINDNQQRVRLGMTFTASENLSGYFQTESIWELGNNDDKMDNMSGSGFDGAAIRLYTRQAYIDWTLPGTDVKIRMGRHSFDMPAYASVSPIISDMLGDGVVVDLPFGEDDAYDITAFWTRMARKPGTITPDDTVQGKKFDIFGLIGKANFDSLEFSPWVLYGAKGKGAEGEHTEDFDNPMGYQGNIIGDARADTIIAGLGMEWTPFDPFTVDLDVAYGHTNYSNHPDERVQDQEGWYVAGKVSYTLDFFEPAIMAWYASGDKKNADMYSGQVPSIFGDFDGTSTYFDGAWGIFGGNRTTIGGTWGVSLQFNDISFIDGLSHDFSVTYFSGTNNKYNGGYGDGYDYLTTADRAVEFDLLTTYEIYKNLTVALELAYIIEDFDTKTEHGRSGESYDNDWRAGLIFQYTF